jgi:Trk K+ transport system NAD-binding subunit
MAGLEGGRAAASGHVIVCGLHDVGLRVIEQLVAAGERVVVVDVDPEPRLVRIVAELGVMHIDASAQRSATLHAAGLASAAALVCVDPDDLRNLDVALLGRRLRPDLRVVVALSNPAVGRAVARVTGPGSVLDVASLSAPSFVEACLGRSESQVDLAGQPFSIVEVPIKEAGTLRSLFGDLAPVAIVRSEADRLDVSPGRDAAVVPGDRAVVIGTPEDLQARGLAKAPHHEPLRARRLRGALVLRYLAGFARETDRRIRWTLIALLALAFISTVLLAAAYRTGPGRHIGVLDALYFTTETLTTVGYGDISFTTESSALKVYAIVLMILGATLVTIVYALLTNLLVSRRLEQSFGRQQVTRMRNHVIVVGLGSVGVRVVEALVAAGVPVVVLDRDENNRYLGNARALRVPVIVGDSTVPATLASANLPAARAVAVLTSNDLANIETGLAVDDLLGERRTRVPVVMRVFDRQLAQTVESSFGFQNVRSTSALAAPWFVGAALGLDILATFYVHREALLLGRLTVSAIGGLTGRTMLDLSARVRVVAIGRTRENGRLEHPPRRDTEFRGGDQAYLVGPYDELLRVLRSDQRGLDLPRH